MSDTALADAPTEEVPGGGGSSSGGGTLAGSTAIVVLGMHRSGTSALAGLLHHLGVALGGHLMPAAPDNPRGYWEHAGIVAMHDRLLAGHGFKWDDIRKPPDGFADDPAVEGELRELLLRDFAGAPLWGVKDPRLCRLLPLWSPLLARLGVAPRFVLVLRHPADVAASLRLRDGIGEPCAGLLWLRHVLEAERGTRGKTRTIVSYETLVGPEGWQPVAARIAAELGLAWPRQGPEATAAAESYLTAELRHHRGGEAGSDAAGRLGGWVGAVYQALAAGGPELAATCDAVQAELDRAGELFLPIVGEAMHALAELHSQREAQDRAVVALTQRVSQAQHEAAELRDLAARSAEAAKAVQQDIGALSRDGRKLARPLFAEDAYPRWIASRASTALARPDWIAERVREWPFTPVLALGAIVPAGCEANVAPTVRSLLAQTVGLWELHIVAAGERPEPLAAVAGLVWHRGEAVSADRLNRVLCGSAAQFVAMIDAGDQLAPHALFAVAEALFRHPEWSALYSDEDRIDTQGMRSAPHFKPDFNLDLMRSAPYVGGLLAVRRDVFAALGGFDPRWDGTEEYDLSLRLAERLGAAGFGHIADVLYHRLTTSGRSRRPVEAICADIPNIVAAHLDRAGIAAAAEPGNPAHTCRVRYRHDGPEPLVSIIVPTRNQVGLLKRCVETVLKLTEYQNYEIIVVDNGSDEAAACAYLDTIEGKFDDIGGRIRVLRHPGEFNYSAMNNRAVRDSAQGEYLCLLNNDATPLDGAWLGELMNLARRPDIGAVGAKLFYPDGRIQHGGVVMGVGWGSVAEHPHNREPGTTAGYWGRLQVVQNYSAVTGACLVTRRSCYDEIGGLDETAFAVAYNDIDYCLKLRAAGYLVAWTPYARLLHEAGVSQRGDVEKKPSAEKLARFNRESLAMFRRWMPQIAFDPAYNRNLSSLGFGFAIETEGAQTWDPDFRPRPRVLVYAADREGCGEYRIIAPSRALFKSGLVHSYETMRLMTPPEVARMAPDSIVFQRQLEWGQIEVIERVGNTSPTFRVFELDDLITNLPPHSPHRANIAPDIAERLKKALSLCQRLVVGTEPLAQRYAKMCGETVVLPNRLEKSRWLGLTPKRRRDGKPRVGWAGAIGHRGDLALIASVVETTAKEVDWVFFGMCPERLRRSIAEYHDWVPLHDYAQKLASLDLDLAVAPLEPHPFNECKSNLRLLEYGVLGYPVLCTDILPYQGDLPVFRVANRPRAWIAAIRELVADRAACALAGERLRQAVVRDWMLEDHLDEWRRAWLP